MNLSNWLKILTGFSIVFSFNLNIYPVRANTVESGKKTMSNFKIPHSQAYWISSDTIACRPELINSPGYRAELIFSRTGNIQEVNGQIIGGELIPLEIIGPITEKDPLYQNFPYLKGYIKVSTQKLKTRISELLKGQLVFNLFFSFGKNIHTTYLQSYGVIDELMAYNHSDLGISWKKDIPRIKLWAPLHYK